MPSSRSFRSHAAERPLHYRTPSPPRYAVEPLSPLRSFNNQSLSASPTHGHIPKANPSHQHHTPGTVVMDETRKGRTPSSHRPMVSNASNRVGGHSRSKSTIDTLATIALATSPTFTPNPYKNSTSNVAVAPTYNPSAEITERPSKRARSEKAPSPSWQRSGHRPASSHVSTLDSMKTDAELLLNFARPVNAPRLPPDISPRSITGDTPHTWNPEPWRNSTSAVANNNKHNSAFEMPSSNLVASNGTPVARLRSRSDGAAALSRPTINGFASGTSHLPFEMGSVLEDGPETHENHTEALSLVTYKQPIDAKEPEDPGLALKSEGVESTSSSQTNCAACKLDRAPVDIGDDAEVTWVNCDGCDRWFHIVCAGFKNDREIRTVDKFICRECRPIHGATTFVRKSSRARTAIDYAGLNQGFIKPPTEANEHHYIKPIKEGKIMFLPDKFARLSPELLTADYFEHGIGMVEPVVIPSHLNPHTAESALGGPGQDTPLGEATTEEEFDEMIDKLSTTDGSYEEAFDCGQDLLDMVIPDNLTVNAVAGLYGPDERIEVIDVKSQQGEDKRWTMQKWVDYYYDNNASKIVRNVISLEVSQCPLGRLIRRPRIVRDLDLQDSVWPSELQAIGDFPKVQFYCLMSVADCYTDFHVDFGGSSVYYHILKGKKTFFFIPPKDKHLKKYEEWCNSPSQDSIFLGNETKECYRVDLSEGDTMMIPSGWIHAVWTPEDSLVIGGNFLTRMNYGMQLKVAKIEKDTKVPRKFRYPHFQKIMWYAALKYLAEDPLPQSIQDAFTRDEDYRFSREYPIYYEFSNHDKNAEPGSEYYNSRFYSQCEIDGLPELAKYILRTALISGGYKVDGVTKETRNAVTRSIPKGQGDPVDTARKFGLWVAWKRGNEPAPLWTRPGAISLDVKVDMTTKRPSRRSSRTINGNKRSSMAHGTPHTAPEQILQTPNERLVGTSSTSSGNGTPVPSKRRASFIDPKDEEDGSSQQLPKATVLGPKRVACDACRKRRIRCRHKNDLSGEVSVGEIETTKGAEREFRTSLRPNAPSTQASQLQAAALSNQSGEKAIPLHQSTKSVPNDTNKAEVAPIKANETSPNSAKKGRVKACDECRKSKRRCVHDETGRIDPIKFHDRPKARGISGPAKRPRSNDDKPGSPKRQKNLQSAYEFEPEAPGFETSAQGQRSSLNEKSEKMVHPSQNDTADNRMLYASPPGIKTELDATSDLAAVSGPVAPASSLVSPPTSLADDVDGSVGNADGEKNTIADGERNASHLDSIRTPTSESCQIPRNPQLVLKATASDATKQPTSNDAIATTDSRTLHPTPSSPSRMKKKPSSRPTSSHQKNEGPSIFTYKDVDTQREGSSKVGHTNVSSVSPQYPYKGNKHGRASFTEVDADEDSLKLIRQLHEEDFGLRKRAPKI